MHWSILVWSGLVWSAASFIWYLGRVELGLTGQCVLGSGWMSRMEGADDLIGMMVVLCCLSFDSWGRVWGQMTRVVYLTCTYQTAGYESWFLT